MRHSLKSIIAMSLMLFGLGQIFAQAKKPQQHKWKITGQWTLGNLKLQRYLACGLEYPLCQKDEYSQQRNNQLIAEDAKGAIDSKLPFIECRSGSALEHHPLECTPVPTQNKKFYLIDCWTAETVRNCEIKLFNSTMTEDKSFKPRFGIDEITVVKIAPNGIHLELEGWFQSKEIDGLSDELRQKCEGEECVGFNGHASQAKLLIDQTGKMIRIDAKK